MTTITIQSVQLRRSTIAGFLPPSLLRGEAFYQLADGFMLVGDGTTLPPSLPQVPFLPAALLPLSNAAITALATKQPLNPMLTSLAGVVTAANQTLLATGPNQLTVTAFTPLAQALLGGVSPAAMQATLALGSMAVQNATAVAVTGGTIDGTVIGGTTPAAGSFTTLAASGGITGALAGNASSATKLATARTLAVSGDMTGSIAFDGTANVTIPGVLAASGVTAGLYGSASVVPVLTFDAKGRATLATTATIAIPSSAITDAASANTPSTVVKRDASGNFAAGTVTAALVGNASTASTLQTARALSLSGDATGTINFDGSAAVAIPVTLAASGVGAGSYGSATQVGTFTADAKGRLTAAASVSIAFPVISVAGRGGAVTLAVGDVSGAAPLASPALTGTPTVPTATAGTSTTQAASTAFVAASFLTITSAAATYAPLASPALTGTPTAPTPAVNDSSTKLATTAFVLGQAATVAPLVDGAAAVGASSLFARQDHVHPTDVTRAPLASPALTGTPTAPTPATSDSSTKVATTAFVIGQAATVSPVMDGTAAVGTSALFARQDHVHPIDTSRAPLASPAFTGSPTAPTVAAGDSSTALATTSFVSSAISGGGGAAAVSYNPQSLSQAQQSQTRVNILAAGLEDLSALAIQVAKLKGSTINLFDAAADDFKDQTGYDTANSVGVVYDGTNNLVGNTTAGTVESSQSLPAMTSNTAPSGYTASASTTYSGSFPAFQAFDQANGTDWSSDATALPQWIARQEPSAITVGAYAIRASSGSATQYAPQAFTLQGSNDGTTWVNLDSQTGQTSWGTSERRVFTIAAGSRAAYSRHRLYCTAYNTSPYIDVAELELLQVGASTNAALTLQSVAFTAQAVPSKASLYLLLKVTAGSATLNTNLTASVSRDGGTTWTAFSLAQTGTLAGYMILEAVGLSITGQPTGSSLKYRVQTTGTTLGVSIDALVLMWG